MVTASRAAAGTIGRSVYIGSWLRVNRFAGRTSIRVAPGRQSAEDCPPGAVPDRRMVVGQAALACPLLYSRNTPPGGLLSAFAIDTLDAITGS